MKLKKYIPTLVIAGLTAGMTTSCSDMLDKGNDFVIYTGDALCNPADTVSSVLGIINKLQAIGVRNNLLGEVRADLVTVNSNATTDLKNLANFAADVTSDDDANIYNNPRDYYAVINNCNYFLAYADSTAGNSNRNEKYFEAEIAQVHSIRAWVYLQTVLAYGKIPYVTEPITTKQGAEEQYPMLGIGDICDKMIADLTPYAGAEYPDYVNVGGDIDPQLMFYPTQVVLGDLYLWKAAINGKDDVADAKKAAQYYYDYIVWDLNGKVDLMTGTDRNYWSAQQIYTDHYMNPSSDHSNSSVWGAKSCMDITKLPMDSAAADGYYNELRNLYNMVTTPSLKEASISPSQFYKDLSANQAYYAYDTQKQLKKVTGENFESEQREKGYVGDLRYQANYNTRDYKYNSKEYEQQTINKHNSQHISIYRSSQIYLRLAEALNYAGYPRFARAILTMGLSNKVIDNEVSRYYTSKEDSTFFQYFDFNNTDYKPYAEDYSESVDSNGVVTSVTPVLRNEESDVNMWGIHSKGSGLAFVNPEYCIMLTPDSTSYPFQLASEVGKEPKRTDYTDPDEPKKPTTVKEPSTWAQYGNTTVTQEEYDALNSGKSWWKKTTYSSYTKNDSVGKYNTYLTETLPKYNTEHAAYEEAVAANDQAYENDHNNYVARLNKFQDAYATWYDSAYGDKTFISKEQKIVDENIRDEQALEMVYEGNRYYDLMRHAMRAGDDTILTEAVSHRDATLGAQLLNNRSKWFLHYKGQIGY